LFDMAVSQILQNLPTRINDWNAYYKTSRSLTFGSGSAPQITGTMACTSNDR
jgi:hypothetical protein